MFRSRVLAGLAAGVLLLSPLAACSSDKSTSAATPSADEVDKVAFVDGLLAAMKAKSTAHVALDLAGSIKGSGQVRYGDTTDLELTAKFGTQQFGLILVGGAAYVQQDAGAKYVKVDKGDPVLSGLVGQLSFAGPREALQALRSGIKKVVKDSTATEGGVALTVYKVTIDAKVAAEAFGGGGGVEDTTATETLDFYVDAQSLVRRVEGKVAGQQITMVISDWGKPVSIKAPAGSDLLNR